MGAILPQIITQRWISALREGSVGFLRNPMPVRSPKDPCLYSLFGDLTAHVLPIAVFSYFRLKSLWLPAALYNKRSGIHRSRFELKSLIKRYL